MEENGKAGGHDCLTHTPAPAAAPAACGHPNPGQGSSHTLGAGQDRSTWDPSLLPIQTEAKPQVPKSKEVLTAFSHHDEFNTASGLKVAGLKSYEQLTDHTLVFQVRGHTATDT